MKNALGQDIYPGLLVYRGARCGNSSEFKIGIVKTINEQKNIARVIWKYEVDPVRWIGESEGSPAVGSLVVIDHSILKTVAEELLGDEKKWETYHKHREFDGHYCFQSSYTGDMIRCATCEGMDASQEVVRSFS